MGRSVLRNSPRPRNTTAKRPLQKEVELRSQPPTGGLCAGLTQREREILVSVSQGMSYARIAEARGVKPVTVRNAIYGIQQKLGVGSMQELVLWSVRNGLLGD